MSRFNRGPGNFLKPENALKRAEELISVGQKNSALQTLHDVITSKRYRTWQKVLEQIMFKYVDLCIELKKGRYAKDGLIHYRNVCQQVNVQSLEEVIKYFMKTATDRAEEAQSKAQAVTLDVEDLEADATPEDLMLSYVSGEKGKDRVDREHVTPWFKFLWETYRTVLDILRNNARLEALYAMTAARAFQFCLTYKRTTEFRRLCDILRNHLANLNKYRDQRDRPDLGNPESMQLYLETRFEQLKVACDLELWQEAFRSVEDIQGLLTQSKKAPKPQMMATYYAKLTKIFTVSDSYLYNGYAWYKLFNLSKAYNKGLSQSDVQQMATSVLLAALSILPYEHRDKDRTEADSELEKERSVRMATILGFSVDTKRNARSILSRTALVSDLSSKGVVNLVSNEVRQIYSLLEADFTPLELCQRLAPLLEKLETVSEPMSGASPVEEITLKQYSKSLQRVAVLRLLQQLSHVYSVMKIPALADLVPFMGFGEVEQIIVDAVKHDFLQVSIDHRNGTVHFGGQQLESDRIRDHISALARRLNKALHMVQPDPSKEVEARRIKAIEHAIATSGQANKRALARKHLIEKRKEEQERLLLEQEREQEEQRMIQLRISEEAEEKRRKADMIKREEDRLKREIEERDLKEAEELLAKTGKGKKLKEGEKLDKNAIMQEALEEQNKARIEQAKKMDTLIKRMDHTERARRENEAPLLQEAYAQKVKDDELDFAEQQKQAAIQHRQQWEHDSAEKQRLLKMQEDHHQFQQQIVSRRQGEFEELQRAREEEIAERKAMKRAERDIARKKEFVRRVRLQIEDRRAEIEARELQAEAERLEREMELEKAREAEKQKKLDEAAAKQRAREQEIEEREKKEREEAAARPSAGGAFVPPSRRAGSFAPPAARGRDEAAEVPRGEGGDKWGRPAPAAAAAVDKGADRPEERPSGAWRPTRRGTGDAQARDAPARGAPPSWGGGPRGAARDGPPAPQDGPPRRFGAGARDPRDDKDAPPRRDGPAPPRRDAPPPARGGSRW
ncbi:hypothetical protein ABBQ32_012895 [Trebouxia sp. C0010 RCD-2024]